MVIEDLSYHFKVLRFNQVVCRFRIARTLLEEGEQAFGSFGEYMLSFSSQMSMFSRSLKFGEPHEWDLSYVFQWNLSVEELIIC